MSGPALPAPPTSRTIRPVRMFGRPVLTVLTVLTGLGGVSGRSLIDTRLLSDAERDCLAAISGPLQQREYAAGRTLIRQVVGRCAGIPPRRVRLALDSQGRPYVRGYGFDVNLSHSGGLVALALGSGVRVGIDVELRRPQPAAEHLARRYFSAPEYDRLRRGGPEDYLPRWYRIWTTREAHAKARGIGVRGIGAPLERHGRDWQRHQPPAPRQYSVSVVALAPERPRSQPHSPSHREG